VHRTQTAGARDVVEYLAMALTVLLPLSFFLVLLAFLLSRGTGCCRLCASSKEERIATKKAALKRRAAEEEAEESNIALCIAADALAARVSSAPREGLVIDVNAPPRVDTGGSTSSADLIKKIPSPRSLR
jgi:hypothetical protein